MKTENQILEDQISIGDLKEMVAGMIDSLVNQYKVLHLKKWVHNQNETLPKNKLEKLNNIKLQLEELERKNPDQQMKIELNLNWEEEKHLKKVQYA